MNVKILQRLVLFVVLMTAGGCILCSAQTGIRSYAITGVTIIDASRTQPAYRQTILIDEGIIRDIFPDGGRSLPDSIAVLRFNGKFILPGLIDTHVHMATDPSGINQRVTTLAVLEKMLLSGITSVRDMAGDGRTLASLSRDAKTGDILSPDIYFSALMAGPSFFKDPRTISSAKAGIAGGMPYMRAVTDSTDLRLAVAEAKGSGASGIKLYANLSPVLVSRIVSEAKIQGMLVWGHAWLQAARPKDLIIAGVSSISHAPLLLYQSMDSVPRSWKRKTLADDRFWQDSLPDVRAVFDLMKQHNTLLDATMSTYQQWYVQDAAMQYDYAITKFYTAAAYRAGVKICAGTDDDQENFVQHELELLVHDAGMSPRDAIIAATRNGAEALGIDGVCGTIEIGKRADLLLVDKNPLDRIEDIRRVVLVIKAGKLIK